MKIKPNWKKAPIWAKWWCVGPDGNAYWFDEKPSYYPSGGYKNQGHWDIPDREDECCDFDKSFNVKLSDIECIQTLRKSPYHE